MKRLRISQIVNQNYPLHIFEVHSWQSSILLLSGCVPYLVFNKLLHYRQIVLSLIFLTIFLISTPTVRRVLDSGKIFYEHLFTMLVLPTHDYPSIKSLETYENGWTDSWGSGCTIIEIVMNQLKLINSLFACKVYVWKYTR